MDLSNPLPSASELLASLVALPGPPGQEDAVQTYLASLIQDKLGLTCRTDAHGNLLTALVPAGSPLPERPSIVVTAHMDEIALMATSVDGEGALRVAPLGGTHPWKWGEGPVEILARQGALLPGVLSFGSIHTTSPFAAAQQARDGRAITWEMARILTGLDRSELAKAGVRPGSRVVLARERRRLWDLGKDLVASYFLDDRADLVAWLLLLQDLAQDTTGAFRNVLFAATASEEVGGEGALFLLQSLPEPPAVCVALEIGPRTPESDFLLDANPTVWVSDTFATMAPKDLDLIEDAARELDMSPHWQAMTRGGSDATCTAAHGLCARPVTLAFPAENSHGFEIMHRDAPEALAQLTAAYLRRLVKDLEFSGNRNAGLPVNHEADPAQAGSR